MNDLEPSSPLFQDLKSSSTDLLFDIDQETNIAIDIIEAEDKDDTPKVAGVETNEASRFVDYTIATSWEQVMADIESYTKKIMKEESKVNPIEINYEGQTFQFNVSHFLITSSKFRTQLVVIS